MSDYGNARKLRNANEVPGFEGYDLIGSTELGKILGRSTKSIQMDRLRNPESLPPHFPIPGTRLLRWRRKDVIAWMDAIAKQEADKRRRAADFAKRFPTTQWEAPRPFALAEVSRHARKEPKST
jgi:hypothetical protein